MKNLAKLLSIIIISTLLLGIVFVNVSHAEDNPINTCKISIFMTPNNPIPGKEVSIDISLSEINVPVAGVGFTLNYDSNIFDFVSIATDNGWNKVDRADSTFMCYQESLESVTTTGKVATIKLKVKDNVTPTKTTIELTGIQVALENNQTVKMGNRSQEITITENPQNNNNNNNNNQNNNNQNNNNQNNNNQNQNNNNNNNGSQYTPPEIDANKIVTINGDTNSNTSNTSKKVENIAKTDNTATSSKNLPKTGKSKVVFLVIALLIGAIYGVIAFNKYRTI